MSSRYCHRLDRNVKSGRFWLGGWSGQRPHDALRSAGRAGRVEHRRAEPFVGDRGVGEVGNGGGVVADPFVLGATGIVDDQHQRDGRAVGDRRQRHVTPGARRDQHLRFAVVEDVGQFVGREVGVDAGVVQTRPLAGPARFEVAVVVLHEDRVVIEPVQAVCSQQVGEPVAALLELSIRDRLAGRRHDEGRSVRVLDGEFPCVHFVTSPLDVGSDVGSV